MSPPSDAWKHLFAFVDWEARAGRIESEVVAAFRLLCLDVVETYQRWGEPIPVPEDFFERNPSAVLLVRGIGVKKAQWLEGLWRAYRLDCQGSDAE